MRNSWAYFTIINYTHTLCFYKITLLNQFFHLYGCDLTGNCSILTKKVYNILVIRTFQQLLYNECVLYIYYTIKSIYNTLQYRSLLQSEYLDMKFDIDCHTMIKITRLQHLFYRYKKIRFFSCIVRV